MINYPGDRSSKKKTAAGHFPLDSTLLYNLLGSCQSKWLQRNPKSREFRRTPKSPKPVTPYDFRRDSIRLGHRQRVILYWSIELLSFWRHEARRHHKNNCYTFCRLAICVDCSVDMPSPKFSTKMLIFEGLRWVANAKHNEYAESYAFTGLFTWILCSISFTVCFCPLIISSKICWTLLANSSIRPP